LAHGVRRPPARGDYGRRFRSIPPSQSRRAAEDVVTQADRRLVSGECHQGQHGLRVRALERLIDGPVDALCLRATDAGAGSAECIPGEEVSYRLCRETHAGNLGRSAMTIPCESQPRRAPHHREGCVKGVETEQPRFLESNCGASGVTADLRAASS
jgi:hypothetical protein